MGTDSSHPGAWAGVWTHKNLLGNHMGAGVAFFLGACLCDPGRRRLWLVFLAATFALVLLSTSATALMLSFIVFGVTGVGAALRRGPWMALAASTGLALAVVAALGAVLLAPDLLFHLIGRDATLTGRTDIWAALSDSVRERPWFGYGFAAFWDEKEGPVYWIRDQLGWGVPNAHNGWLELALALGLVGAGLAALHVARTYWRAGAALRDPEAGRVAPAFLAMFLLVTLTEGYLLQDNNALWAVYVAMAAKLALGEKGIALQTRS
jgi:O-antigen ligase